jgi:hypothetical protein
MMEQYGYGEGGYKGELSNFFFFLFNAGKGEYRNMKFNGDNAIIRTTVGSNK